MSDSSSFPRPAMGARELAAMKAVLGSGWITTDPGNQQLEKAFCQFTGNQHAAAICSATAGMHITLMASGVNAGDGVIMPSITWVSTLNMIVLLGATPVMIDAGRDTLMVTPEQIEVVITPRIKATVPAYYVGAPADLNAIYAIGERYGIPVIEDTAHTIGTLYKGRHVGARGTAISSFHVIKNITCAEGGLVATDDSQLVQRLYSPKFHGPGVDVLDRQTYGQVPQAEVLAPGYKHNLTDINAAIALARPNKLEQLNLRRVQIAQYYQQVPADMPLQLLGLPQWSHIRAWHLLIVRVDETHCELSRDALTEALRTRDIGTGPHFRAAHMQKYYRERFAILSFPDTEQNSARTCSPPLFPDMTEADIQRVVTALREVAGQ